MKPEYARKNVIAHFDLSEAINLIKEESKKGMLECTFRKGCSNTDINALNYRNGLIALGYNVKTFGPFIIVISWEN